MTSTVAIDVIMLALDNTFPLSLPVQSVLLVHDTVRARSYETPLPAYDPNFHPQTQYSRHRHHGRGPEYRTVGLHKSANEPLVSEYLIVILMLTPLKS